MATAALPKDDAATVHLENLVPLCEQALAAADKLALAVRAAVSALIVRDGRVDRRLLEAHQSVAHGYGWYATYVEALRQTLNWAKTLKAEGRGGELEDLILQAGFGEYCAQLAGGLQMSQVEWARPSEMGASDEQIAAFAGTPAVRTLMRSGNTEAARARIAELVADSLATGAFGDTGLDDVLAMVRDQFRRFAEDKVIPYAHDWHLKDELIPAPVVAQMSELGVFGLTIPEEYGGLGMGKTAMCVVSEELSRGYIGVGSLGTRSEIAAELILNGGAEDQKQHWLPKIASGEILPTAVFTEPNTGSDLGSLRTRAVRDGDVYRITGNKTWITHAARTDMMTLLARTDPAAPGYKGLSMFIAEKPRGTDEQKQQWLPRLAGGEILPTAVFTEPNTGSDLGSLRTRAVKD
ncbi:MAG: acyl-CoA dehydrogenase, partial [Alphaproteobacteria bacterium]|nr:acyl-CoA dehydrogenase [Alphaproteobacteria bacterium]